MESSPQKGILGKMAVGIAIIDLKGNRISFGRATNRYFCMYLTVITFYLAILLLPLQEKDKKYMTL
ncbi:MAG: RDD family protein [Okeania sp. SIO3B3]|nr:RDD family protein [Okeania sp. SIO3B3]